MSDEAAKNSLKSVLCQRQRVEPAQLPTPLHHLKNFSQQFEDQETGINRDDLTGLKGDGNKTRNLEYLVRDALASGYDMLGTVGASQSNHTRQTAATAAK